MRGDLRILAVVFAVTAACLILIFMVGVPLAAEAIASLEVGVGPKEAAKWSFGTTVVLFLVFAVVAGDGLLGELQYMLLGFFAFFAIITVLIAWAF
jgi:hypothetical protein